MKVKKLQEKLEGQNIPNFNPTGSPPSPVGSYVAVYIVGDLAFVSGQMPFTSDGTLLKFDLEKDIEYGQYAARLAMANVFHQLCNDVRIKSIEGIARLEGYFLHGNGDELAIMLNGASNLIKELMGSKSDHSRTVFGVSALPSDAVVELAVTVSIKHNEE